MKRQLDMYLLNLFDYGYFKGLTEAANKGETGALRPKFTSKRMVFFISLHIS